MLERRVRQIFWMLMGLATIGVFTNMAPPSQIIEEHREAMAALIIPEESVPAAPVEGTPEWSQPQVDEFGKEMTLKGKVYVKIDEDWYLKRDDNVYNVKGVKTYFVDNSRVGIEIARRAKGKALIAADSNQKTIDQKATQLLEKIGGNPLRVYSPENVQDMMQVVEQTKASAMARQKALKDLSRSN